MEIHSLNTTHRRAKKYEHYKNSGPNLYSNLHNEMIHDEIINLSKKPLIYNPMSMITKLQTMWNINMSKH